MINISVKVAILLLLSFYTSGTTGQGQLFGTRNGTRLNRNGNAIVIGGFFAIHEWNSTTQKCSNEMRPSSGFQRLEAAKWALENLASGATLETRLSGGTLGFDLRDSCSKDTLLRDEALKFIDVGIGRCEYQDNPISMVLGASSSELSVDLTNLLTLFRVPLISYAATSERLNDPMNLFYRTLPPDGFQVRAMVAVMNQFNWSYVSLVYTDDEYGRDSKDTFVSLQQNSGNDSFRFCIAAQVPLTASSGQGTLNKTLDLISQNTATVWHSNASVVILFVSSKVARNLFMAASNRRSFPERQFTFIASDTLSGDVYALRGLGDLPLGIISVEPLVEHSRLSDFLQSFRAKRRADFGSHAWYDDFFQAMFPNCTSFASTPCSSYRVDQSSLFRPDSKLAAVIRAVDVSLESIRNTIQSTCGTTSGFCANARTLIDNTRRSSVDATQLLAAIEKQSLTGNPSTVSYHSAARAFLRSDDPYQYSILNVVPATGNVLATGRTLDFKQIGTWSSKTGLSLSEMPVFRGGGALRKSVCADDCGPGEFTNRQGLSDSDCCWRCQRCDAHHFAANSLVSRCTRCPPNRTANSMSTGCVDLQQIYVDFIHGASIFTLLLSFFGLVSTVGIGVVFIRNYNTPLVTASSRELSACLFVGLMLAYLIPMAFFLPPGKISCGLRRFGLGFTLTLCLSALLVKTNRISRIFNRRMGAGRPKYTSPGWQLVFTGLLVSLEVLFLGIWLILEPPAWAVKVERSNEKLLLVCKHSSSTGLALTLSYNIILLLICTYYGITTRKIPENFNEAKYINFSTYTLCAVSFAFIPAFLTVREDIKPSMLIMAHVLNSTCMLGFLLAPKAYIIVFHPEQNVRSTKRRKSKDYAGNKVHMRKLSQAVNSGAGARHGITGGKESMPAPSDLRSASYVSEKDIPEFTAKSLPDVVGAGSFISIDNPDGPEDRGLQVAVVSNSSSLVGRSPCQHLVI